MRPRYAIAFGLSVAAAACGLEVVGNYVPGPPPPAADVVTPAPVLDSGCGCPRDFVCEGRRCLDRPRDHFTLERNPNANWSWLVKVVGAAEPYALDAGHVFVSGDPMSMWAPSTSAIVPAVWFNDRDASVVWSTMLFEPFEIGAHPGSFGERTYLRWTAPSAGAFGAEIQVTSVPRTGAQIPATVAAFVYHGASVLRTGHLDTGRTTVRLDIPPEAFAAGDVLDVVLTWGDDSQAYYDGVGIEIVVHTPDPPGVADAGVDADASLSSD